MLVVVASLGYHASWRRGLIGLAALAGGVLLYFWRRGWLGGPPKA